jgi:hypothetical protein
MQNEVFFSKIPGAAGGDSRAIPPRFSSPPPVRHVEQTAQECKEIGYGGCIGIHGVHQHEAVRLPSEKWLDLTTIIFLFYLVYNI